MISKEEAYRISNKVNKKEAKEQLNEIDKRIQESAELGITMLVYDGPLYNEVEKELKKLGYRVDYIWDDENPFDFFYTIEWDLTIFDIIKNKIFGRRKEIEHIREKLH